MNINHCIYILQYFDNYISKIDIIDIIILLLSFTNI